MWFKILLTVAAYAVLGWQLYLFGNWPMGLALGWLFYGFVTRLMAIIKFGIAIKKLADAAKKDKHMIMPVLDLLIERYGMVMPPEALIHIGKAKAFLMKD